jgi:capsular exopolysaccharide synthesis family protein
MTFAEIAAFLRRYTRTILGCTAVAIVGASVYALTSTPVYTARTQLVIEPKVVSTVRDLSGEVRSALDAAQVESQIVIIRSEKIAQSVVEQLSLTSDKEYVAPRGFLSLLMGRRAAPETESELVRRAAVVVQQNLDARRIGQSYSIDVFYTSRDPEKAARVANAVVNAYIKDQVDAKSEAARQGGDWLEERSRYLRTQMNQAVRNVQEFRAARDYRLPSSQDQSSDKGAASRPNRESQDRNTLDELEATAQTYRRIYESFLLSLADAVQRQSFPVPDARVITSATRPFSKSNPGAKLVVLFGTILGATSGLGLALLRHNLDPSVRSGRQIRVELGIDCLGEIPRIQRRQSVPQGQSQSRTRSGQIPKSAESLLTHMPTMRWRHHRDAARLTEVVDAPFSYFTDSMRIVKASIAAAQRKDNLACIGITSARPREGKSTLASNLAALFAGSGARVLLVDTDVRNAGISRTLAPNAAHGLLEVLEGKATLASAAQNSGVERVSLLSVGTTQLPPGGHDLVSSERMRALLAEARKTYDQVIVDLPPLHPIADALVIGTFCDAILLTAAWGKTPIEELGEAAYSLRASQAKVLGVVITMAEFRPHGGDSYYQRPPPAAVVAHKAVRS